MMSKGIMSMYLITKPSVFMDANIIRDLTVTIFATGAKRFMLVNSFSLIIHFTYQPNFESLTDLLGFIFGSANPFTNNGKLLELNQPLPKLD